jgi:hypothetical protein
MRRNSTYIIFKWNRDIWMSLSFNSHYIRYWIIQHRHREIENAILVNQYWLFWTIFEIWYGNVYRNILLVCSLYLVAIGFNEFAFELFSLSTIHIQKDLITSLNQTTILTVLIQLNISVWLIGLQQSVECTNCEIQFKRKIWIKYASRSEFQIG